MKRSTRFLIAFVAATLTFGTLRAFVGPTHWNRWHGHHHHCYEDSHERDHWHEHKREHSHDAPTPKDDQPDSSQQ